MLNTMQKFTKKSLLFDHILEERGLREKYDRLTEEHEDAGRVDKAEAAYRRACNAAARESAFICAAAIFLGLSGNDLERELAIYDYERRFK